MLIKNNYFLIIGVIMMQGLHIFTTHIPFMQELFSINPVSFERWLSFFIIAGTIIVVMEVFKEIRDNRDKEL